MFKNKVDTYLSKTTDHPTWFVVSELLYNKQASEACFPIYY